MRRALAVGMVLGCVAIAVVAAMSAQAKDNPAPAAPAAASATPPAQPGAVSEGGEKVVFTFDSEEKMKAFETLWRQRQVAAVRMTVLQSYWNEEQVLMTKLNEQLAKDYQVDVTKAYSLDPEKKVLIEHSDQEAMPVPQASIPPGSPAPSSN